MVKNIFSRYGEDLIGRADEEPVVETPAAAATGVEQMVLDAVRDLRGFCDTMRADFATLQGRMDSFEKPAARADAVDGEEADVSGVAVVTPTDGTVVTEAASDLAEPAAPVETDRVAAVETGAEQTANLPEVEMASVADRQAAAAVAPLRADIDRLSRLIPAELSIEQRQAFAAAQEHADTAFRAFGDQAPAPMQGESLGTYKRRLASKMQGHSEKWKGTKLTSISDDSTLDVIMADIYNDAAAVARRGADVAAGSLMPVQRRTQAGHTIIEYRGSPGAWMRPLAGATRRATGKFNTGR